MLKNRYGMMVKEHKLGCGATIEIVKQDEVGVTVHVVGNGHGKFIALGDSEDFNSEEFTMFVSEKAIPGIRSMLADLDPSAEKPAQESLEERVNQKMSGLADSLQKMAEEIRKG